MRHRRLKGYPFICQWRIYAYKNISSFTSRIQWRLVSHYVQHNKQDSQYQLTQERIRTRAFGYRRKWAYTITKLRIYILLCKAKMQYLFTCKVSDTAF